MPHYMLPDGRKSMRRLKNKRRIHEGREENTKKGS
jgi:hypothetical protein